MPDRGVDEKRCLIADGIQFTSAQEDLIASVTDRVKVFDRNPFTAPLDVLLSRLGKKIDEFVSGLAPLTPACVGIVVSNQNIMSKMYSNSVNIYSGRV